MNIIFACICIVVVNGATLGRSRTGGTAPCFLNGSGSPADEKTLAHFAQKISAQINDFKVHCQTLKQTMEREYCIEVPVTTSFLSVSTVEPAVDNATFVHDFFTNTTSFLKKMRYQYDKLNQLANYFEHLNKTAKDKISTRRLTETQTEIYNVMCSQKLALRSQNQDPVCAVPSGDLSQEFELYHKENVVCKQQTLEYATLLDSVRIASYLETMYSSFKATSVV